MASSVAIKKPGAAPELAEPDFYYVPAHIFPVQVHVGNIYRQLDTLPDMCIEHDGWNQTVIARRVLKRPGEHRGEAAPAERREGPFHVRVD